MGEELENKKVYFKKIEDDKYKELENIGSIGIQELQVNDIEFEKTAYKEYQEEMMKLYDDFLKMEHSWKGLAKGIDVVCKCVFDRETTRQLKRLAGISPLSKKRTRKLLMAHGFDRDSAQMYADTMYPRNMNAIKELIEIAENSGI